MSYTDRPWQPTVPAVFRDIESVSPRLCSDQLSRKGLSAKWGGRRTCMANLSCQEFFIANVRADTMVPCVPTRPILEESIGEAESGRQLKEGGGEKAPEKRGKSTITRMAPRGCGFVIASTMQQTLGV